MTDRRPHIVGVVGNDIVFDTRIRKVAAAAAAAGFRSTILCYTAGAAPTKSSLPGVEVLRVPVEFKAHLKNGRVPSPLRPLDGNELAGRHEGPRVYQQMRKRRLEALGSDAKRTSLPARLRLLWARASLRLRHDAFRARRKAHVTLDKLMAKALRWRRRVGLRALRRLRDGVPNIADYEVTFGPILEELEPDLIHAHDYHMIGLAVTAARNLRARGVPTKVLYDAHELIEGLSYTKPVIEGWLRLEGMFINDVDAVTGVSPEQVARIQERYRLDEPPTVVMNAPVVDDRKSKPADPTLRDVLGVDGRILLYHGNVFEERGLDTVIEALTELDDGVHLAVLAPKNNPLVALAEDRARQLGVSGRLHILEYVPTERLLHFISGADVAVVPYLYTGNNDIALPNKLFESIQAGLPVLVSNMRSLSRFVREFEVGEVFEAGSPADLADKARAMLDRLDEYRLRITDDVKRSVSWDAQAAELTAVYARLLGVPQPPPFSLTTDDIKEESVEATVSAKPTKLAIGPRNMAGQAYAMAAAVQEHLGIPAVSYSMEKMSFGFPIHHQISGQDWRDPMWQAQQRKTLRSEFTHVLAESGTGILGAMNGGFIDDQLPYLVEDGLDVAILLHGSEIRDPRRHRSHPHSPFAEDDEFTRSVIKANDRLRQHLDGLEIPIFATTPDLLEEVDAEWLPVVVTGKVWTGLKPPFQRSIPTVLHLPSSTRMKGSEHIDPVLDDLARAGRIRYLRPEGPTSATDVVDLVEESDIVVDQIVIGAYGLMACQALAAGRIAVANTRDIGFLTPECPIVPATPETLPTTMETLLQDRAGWPDLSEAGRAFVAKYHDGAYTAEVLRRFLESP